MVWRGLGGPQNEAKRDKNTKERRQDDPGPPRPEFVPLWCPGRGRFWGPKSIKIGPKRHSNIDHLIKNRSNIDPTRKPEDKTEKVQK